MKKHKSTKKNKGFSLIELLIVVAIILIIAAIAIPNLLRSRIAANEASAVGSVRTITTAEITFNTTYPGTGYADLAALGGTSCALPTSASACLIDNTLASASATPGKSGYLFATVLTGSAPASGFSVNADPITEGTTGVRAFCNSTDGVIRYWPDNTGITATTTEAQCQAVTTVL